MVVAAGAVAGVAGRARRLEGVALDLALAAELARPRRRPQFRHQRRALTRARHGEERREGVDMLEVVNVEVEEAVSLECLKSRDRQ